LMSSNMSEEGKVLMLQKLYDISEEEAVIVAQTISNENGTGEQ